MLFKVSKQLLEIIRNAINQLQSPSWIKPDWRDCILSSVGDSAKFKIMDAKLHAVIVTLSTKDNVNLTKK